MKSSIWNKRIPGLSFVIILVVGFFVVSFVTGNKTNYFTRASPGPEPKNIQVTNVSDTSFTISYQTSGSVAGSISYTQSGLHNVAFDDRDSARGAQTHFLHYFTLKNLLPHTLYKITIVSGGNLYTDLGSNENVTTGDTLPSATPAAVIKGTVLFPENITKEAIVYASTSAVQPISALVGSNGSYVLDSSSIRTTHGDNYIAPSQTQLKLTVQGNSVQTQTDLPSAVSQIVPPIILGNSYDFSKAFPTETVATAEAFPTTTLHKTITATSVQILTPANGEAFSSQQPTFKGTAAPQSTVNITIHSDNPIQVSIKTDTVGNWKYTPPNSLTPGEHTMTIVASDAFGITRTITKTFYVYSSGAQFLVPSVITQTPTPTTVTLTITPTPSLAATISPTQAVVSTVTPTLSQQITITPTVTLVATLTPTLTTGITLSTTPQQNMHPGSNAQFISILVALIPVILGGLLIFLSKGVIR